MPADVRLSPGCLVHFTMEAALPESISERSVTETLGGKTKVRFLELNEVCGQGWVGGSGAGL